MRHFAVIDLAYGDSGKGALVDRLCNEHDVSVVVRFNGGCQAAHNVVTDDGRHHTFAQFGSGTFWGVPTYLSRFVLVEPLSLFKEAEHLEEVGIRNPLDLMFVSPDSLVTTPYHWLVNRWREDQLEDRRHGSCGRGVGATQEFALQHRDALRVIDLAHVRTALEKLDALHEWARDETDGLVGLPHPAEVMTRYEPFRKTVKIADETQLKASAVRGPVVFEGAQGVLLDEDWGFHPHTTWSRCTGVNARELVAELSLGELEEVGVVRAYTTRHGAGPFVTEDSSLNMPEAHNKDEHYQGGWRVGHFDVVAATYAMRANQGVAGIYVTHVDSAHREPNLKLCTRYLDKVTGNERRLLPHFFDAFDARADQTDALFRTRPRLVQKPSRVGWGDVIAHALGVPLYGIGTGPRTSDGVFTQVTTRV